MDEASCVLVVNNVADLGVAFLEDFLDSLEDVSDACARRSRNASKSL